MESNEGTYCKEHIFTSRFSTQHENCGSRLVFNYYYYKVLLLLSVFFSFDILAVSLYFKLSFSFLAFVLEVQTPCEMYYFLSF